MPNSYIILNSDAIQNFGWKDITEYPDYHAASQKSDTCRTPNTVNDIIANRGTKVSTPVGHRRWGRAAAAKYHTFVHWKEEETGTCPVLLDSADETCAVSLPVYPKEHSVHTKVFPLYTVCRSIPRNIQLHQTFPSIHCFEYELWQLRC